MHVLMDIKVRLDGFGIQQSWYRLALMSINTEIERILADNIHARRKALGLTQVDLAEASQKSRGAIAQVETATIWPTAETFRALMQALNMSASELLKSPEEREAERNVFDDIQKIEEAMAKDPATRMEALRVALQKCHQILKIINLAAETSGYPPEWVALAGEFARICAQFSRVCDIEESGLIHNPGALEKLSRLSPAARARLAALDEREIEKLVLLPNHNLSIERAVDAFFTKPENKNRQKRK